MAAISPLDFGGPTVGGLAATSRFRPRPCRRKGGWFNAPEAEADEAPESEPETLRALGTPLPDGSTLVVANERRRSDETLRRVMTAFAWALGGTIALGAAGGLWLSAQFLRRIDVMRRAARGIMAGDWSRRIPLASVDDDLSALARKFNRLFDRIETLLLANKHMSADIAHDLRKPLSHVLRRLEAARSGTGGPAAVAEAIEGATAEVECVLETFDANCLDNALTHTPPGVLIEIKAARGPSRVCASRSARRARCGAANP